MIHCPDVGRIATVTVMVTIKVTKGYHISGSPFLKILIVLSVI